MAQRVLILCTGNSCRSQMAQASWQRLGQDAWTAESAGSKPAGYVHPLALQAIEEIGLDASSLRSKSVDEFLGQKFDLAVTVCDHAREACPVLPGVETTLHWPFDDPATATGSEEEKMNCFRRVRDQIRERIKAYLNDDFVINS